MITRLLDGILLKENRDAGFGLMVMADGELQLHRHGILLHGFNDSATMAEINYEAEIRRLNNG